MLTLHFTLPLKNPVKPKQLVLEVFDRSYFIDFQMAKDNPVKLVGAPAGCQMKLERPSDGTASRAEAQRADLPERRELEFRHDVRQQDHGGLPVKAHAPCPRAGSWSARWPLPPCWCWRCVAPRSPRAKIRSAHRARRHRRPSPRLAASSAGCWRSSRNSTARCRRPSAPQSPTARRCGRCSSSPSPMASSTPPGPATARR